MQHLIALVLASIALTACASASPPSSDDAGADSAPDAAVGDVAPAADASVGASLYPDASAADAAAPADARDTTCDPNWYTQASCYGFGVDGGTSHVAACEQHAGCSLLEDDAGANPSVWCCPNH